MEKSSQKIAKRRSIQITVLLDPIKHTKQKLMLNIKISLVDIQFKILGSRVYN